MIRPSGGRAFREQRDDRPGPVVMPPRGQLSAVAIGNSLMSPVVVIRPIRLLPACVNHSAPSGPLVICRGLLKAVGIGNSVKTPLVVMRPMLP